LLPLDFTREIPTHAWKWLLQYGLTYQFWKDGCGFAPAFNRLVFRVGDTSNDGQRLLRNDTPLAFSIGRFIPLPEVQVPTQLEPSGSTSLRQGGGVPVQRTERPPAKWYVWGDCHKHAEVLTPDQGTCVVLVEDLISAHKVSAAGGTAIPLFGTKIHNPVLYFLMHDKRPVKLWLDKDQEGNVKRTAIHLQGLIGSPVDVVITDEDPKCLSFNTIKEYL
jgi:hypothetical protein